MEALSAFSLACGIFQVVEFSIKVVKKCRELYKDGTLSENTEVEEMAKHLTELRTNLDLTDQGGMDELLDLGSKCSQTAQELVVEVQKLKVNGSKRKRQVVGKTLKAIWRKSAIEDIQKRLGDYQKLLDSRILVDLRKRSDLLALRQSEGFQDLDLKVQTIIKELAQSPQSFEELRTLIQLENGAIKAHITNELQQHQRDSDHDRYRQRYLESLWYPEIGRRQDVVAEAHQRTFQWIYEPEGFDKSARRWDNMVHWLEQSGGIYWINGKAGSGKSTLMKYIYRDDRTSNLLRAWSGGKELCTPGFFFWNAGTNLEKSSEGLLRSLLYQILQRFPGLTPLSCENRAALGPAKDAPQNCEPTAAWTEHRLTVVFEGVMRQAQEICRICIFIDGLDEISGESDATIALIENMQSTGVKVCLSSRPERCYVEAFGSCAMLRLQDLTKSDIRTYVSDKLHPLLRAEAAHNVSEILKSIALKARGVFLWVELVVKTLITGLKNGDSLKQLWMRFWSTLSDIEALYAKMLSSVDPAYQDDAALLFRMAFANLTESLLNVSLALYKRFDRVSEISVGDAVDYCNLSQKRIPIICAGLLEINLEDKGSEEGGGKFRPEDRYLSLPIVYTCSLEEAEMSFYERYAHVDFIHRTANDFLRNSKQGQLFLEANSRSCPSPHSTYVRALLAKVTLLGFLEKPATMNDGFKKYVHSADDFGYDDQCDDFVDKVARVFICEIMRTVSVEEWNTGTEQGSLCEDVDRTLATVHQRYQSLSATSHWLTRWGLNIVEVKKRNGFVSWSTVSSRSNSPGTFHSAKSEPRLFAERPVDFLGYAVVWNLCYTVRKMIELQQKHLDKEYVNYVLCCSTWALCYGGYQFWLKEQLPKLLNLIAELVSYGGDPNTYVERFSTTIWGLFLGRAPWSVLCARKSFVTTTKTFLENGADVHMTLLSQIAVRESWQDQAALKRDYRPEMYFRHKMSALHVLRSRLENTPELIALEKIIVAKGGCDDHRYTHVALRKDSYRPYRISERLHNKFIAALNAAHHGYENHGDKHIPTEERLRWAEQLGKIYKEVSDRDGDSNSETSSDEDATSDTDAEDEFYESIDFPTTTDVQDCQLIDG